MKISHDVIPSTASSHIATTFGSTSVAMCHFCVVQKTGTIDRVRIMKSGSGTSNTYGVRIETISAGKPSGTLWATNTSGSGTFSSSSANTTLEITLTASASVTKGDIIAVIVYCSVFNASNNLYRYFANMGENPCLSSNSIPGNCTHAAYTVGTTSGWTASGSDIFSAFGAVYTDDEPVHGCYPIGSSVASTTVPTSGTNAYLGNKFSINRRVSVEGIKVSGRLDGSFRVAIYNSSNTELAGKTFAASVWPASASESGIIFLDTAIILNKGDTYRIILTCISGTIQLTANTSYNSTQQTVVLGDLVSTTSTNASSWTDGTNTFNSIIPMINEVVSGNLVGDSGLIY